MFVTGVGKTKFGVLEKTLPQLMHEAAGMALADGGLGVEELDAIYVANFLGGSLQNQLHLNSVLAGLLPGFSKPAVRVETACASGGSAVYQALLSLSRFSNVLVVGVEKMTDVEGGQCSKCISGAGDASLDQAHGLIFPANYALIAQQHMQKYGTTHEDLELLSLKAHENARLNPLAHFNYKQVTADEIKDAEVVCSPLTLYDCSPISDGASAVVVSKEKKGERCVKVTGSALATDSISLAQRKDLTSFNAAKLAAKQAYGQAGKKPSDIDVFEVHDCFTIAELVAMEDLGLCKAGESKDLVREGRTKVGGDIPINTGGGLKGGGHPIGATGVSQIFDIVLQLRGEAGERQVDGARAGLAHNIGGVGGTAAVHILEAVD